MCVIHVSTVKLVVAAILGGVQPQKTQTQNGDSMVMMGFLGFLGFWEKGVKHFLNIPDILRPYHFFHFFKGISSGSDTFSTIYNKTVRCILTQLLCSCTYNCVECTADRSLYHSAVQSNTTVRYKGSTWSGVIYVRKCQIRGQTVIYTLRDSVGKLRWRYMDTKNNMAK